MDKKVEYIAELLGMENQDVALVLYTYLSKVLEDLVHNRYAVTMFGELVLDKENNIVFKNNKFEFNNKLFDRKDILSILQVVEYGPGGRVF